MWDFYYLDYLVHYYQNHLILTFFFSIIKKLSYYNFISQETIIVVSISHFALFINSQVNFTKYC